MSHKRIKDIFPDYEEKSYFFQYLGEMPWGENTYTQILMHTYAGVHSGERIASPFLLNLNARDAEERDIIIATMIKTHFKARWEHLYSLLGVDYNPIENYNMVEKTTTKTTGNSTTTGTDSNTRTLDTTDKTVDSGTDKRTDDLTENTTDNVSRETSTTAADTAKIYGFNTSTGKPANSSDSNGSGTEKSTDTATKTNTGTSTLTQDKTSTVTDTGTIKDAGESKSVMSSDGTSDGTLTRSGNIGVTTTQQMMEQEVNFWNNFSFFEQVYKDIDSLLTLNVY